MATIVEYEDGVRVMEYDEKRVFVTAPEEWIEKYGGRIHDIGKYHNDTGGRFQSRGWIVSRKNLVECLKVLHTLEKKAHFDGLFKDAAMTGSDMLRLVKAMKRNLHGGFMVAETEDMFGTEVLFAGNANLVDEEVEKYVLRYGTGYGASTTYKGDFGPRKMVLIERMKSCD